MEIVKHKLPKLSQFLDVKNKSWKNRSCGVVALMMVMQYYDSKIKTSDISKIISRGYKNGHYLKGIGWRHDGLIKLAEQYGFSGKRMEFKSVNKTTTKKLISLLKKSPLIVSVFSKFNPENGGGHLAVLCGYKKENNQYTIFINDTDSKTRKGITKEMLLEDFLNGWKKRIIIIKR